MQTLDQKRAEFAWERVQRPTKEYRNLAKSLPALVMSNGLMQTLAFLQGKGKGEHARLLQDILHWLTNKPASILPQQAKNFEEAMKSLASMDTLAYQRATEDTLDILRWIRQLADTLPIEGAK